MCSHQCVMDVTFGSFLVFFSLISVPIVYISISPFWHFFVVERTLAWHWWCKQLQNQEDAESEEGGGVGGGVWRDAAIFLVFKNGGTSPAFSHRGDSEEGEKRVHDFCHLAPAGPLCMNTMLLEFSLRHVAVLVCRGLASLDVLLVNEHFDALFDHADTWVEPGFGLVDDLHATKWNTIYIRVI